jgi:hypothetical protein
MEHTRPGSMDDGGEGETAVEILPWAEASGAAKPADMPSLGALAEELVDVGAQAAP